MSVLITGVTGLANRGVEALLVPILSNLRRLLPSEDIRVLSPSAAGDALRASAEACSFEPDPFQGRRRSRRPFADGALRRIYRHTADWRRARQVIARADLVVVTGGDIFSSDYSNQNAHLEPLGVAAQRGVPIVLLAHSIGPYRSRREAEDWMTVARRTAAVTLREELSYAYVSDELQLHGPRLELTADPAFLLEPVAAAKVSALLDYYGPKGEERSLVGIAPSVGISRFKGLDTSGEQTSERHLEVWTQVTRFLLDEVRARVLLIPHVQTPGTNDDRIICDAIVRRLGHDPRVTAAWGDLRAAEYKGLAGRCSLLIAERMHAGIGALSSLVPTLLVGYSVKAQGVLSQSLGGSDLLSDCLIDFPSFLDGASAREFVARGWSARRRIQERLEKNMPRVRALAEKNFEILGQIAEDVRPPR